MLEETWLFSFLYSFFIRKWIFFAGYEEGPLKMFVGESKLRTLRSQLDLFDKTWCTFFNSFVIWKVKDAWLLEDDKVRAACQLVSLSFPWFRNARILQEEMTLCSLMTRKRFRLEIRKALLSFPKDTHYFFLYCIRYYCYYSPTLLPLQYIINNEKYVS